jgi:hypothetical protein
MTQATIAAMIGAKAAGGARLCGPGRSIGGLYLESGLSVGGVEVEQMLLDPPQPVNPEDLGVSAIGVTLWEGMDGVTHVLDMVGVSHYSYVSDFIEEGRIKGFSRKVSPNLDFGKLSPGSRLVFLHTRGRVVNYPEYSPDMLPDFVCPCGKAHTAGSESCIGLLWRLAPETVLGLRMRQLSGGNSYALGKVDPAHPFPAPEYTTAMFASVPITSISLIAGGADQEMKLAKAQQSGFPVDLVGE